MLRVLSFASCVFQIDINGVFIPCTARDALFALWDELRQTLQSSTGYTSVTRLVVPLVVKIQDGLFAHLFNAFSFVTLQEIILS